MNKTFKKIFIVWAGATLISLFFVAQAYFYIVTVDKKIDIPGNLVYELTYYYTWAILLLLIIPLARKFKPEKKSLLKNLPLHFVLAIVFALLHRSISFIAYLLLIEPGRLIGGIPIWTNPKILGGSFNSFLNYWIILGMYYGITYYQQFRDEKVRSAQLETELANSQLQALKMQLQPHFLFNTLHAVSSLMDESVQKARQTLTLLSNLLRLSLDNIGKQFATLKEELDFVKSYLEIEKTRYQERLEIEYNIEDNLLDLHVPNLILQPLVENAVKHGIAPKSEGGKIVITGKRVNNNLILSVKDNGTGSGSKTKTSGLGLINVESRLEKIYPDNFRMEIINKNGFEVIITIPADSDRDEF